MIAYKSTVKVANYRIQVNVPENFNNQEVEIIVLMKLQPPETKMNEFPKKRQILLSILKDDPTWDDSQEKSFSDVQNYMNSWKITEF